MQIESRRTERAPVQAPVQANGDPVFFTAGSPARGEFLCAECGYGIAVRSTLPECPMCRGLEWEEPSTSPYARRTL